MTWTYRGTPIERIDDISKMDTYPTVPCCVDRCRRFASKLVTMTVFDNDQALYLSVKRHCCGICAETLYENVEYNRTH